ncbi:OmpA family protein [Cytophagaceae bacterium YF14B1]|uniref:OmpA family protein n=1 Tax=Xanthocytophaga flava TaxID=3048013 RepID=A0AAE3QUC4_9BACT|nr:OmpA family protein [Xanthocytophaga flavus]MDJ1485136.1 OmpA family protein [Xanthocytophaga flavus]
MRHRILFFLLLLSFAAQGQSTLWFYDDFVDNHHGWPVSESAENRYAVGNGVYTLEVKNGNVYWVWKYVHVNDGKDFIYEVIARKKTGEEGADFGITALGKNGTVYQFRINPTTQKSWVGSFKKEWKSIVNNEAKAFASEDYKASSSVKKDTTLNKLTLQRKGDEILFLVNDVEVFRGGYSKLFERFDGNLGFIVAGKMTMEVEKASVKQDNAVNTFPNMPAYLKKENLGPAVNTTYDEVVPRIAPDGKTIYYSIKQHPDNTGGTSDSDDAWYSELGKDGKWGPRKKLSAPPNGTGSTYVVSPLPDNNTLVMNCKYDENMNIIPEWGLSVVQKTTTGWKLRENIDIPDFYSKANILEMAVSADQKAILVTLKRQDSYGERDIYVSLKGEDGKWSIPFNIGNVVNTKGDESSPFMAADGVSLYFGSDGHPGYGASDIFVSHRLDDTWKNWSAPMNLGLAINTPGWDGYYTIPASGDFAYLTSDQNSIGKLDIVKLSIPDVAKPKPVVLVYGTVLNSKTKQPVQADITYRDLSNNKELGTATSNPVDGSYKIVLPAGVVYSFLAQKADFYAVSENIDLKKLNKYQEIKRDLYLSPIEVGQTVRLNNLFFDSNKFELRNESKAELDRLIAILKDNAQMKIKIEGHTDNVGDATSNMTLSGNRAKAVVTYLTSKGIEAGRLTSQGYGKGKPVGVNTTEEGRQKNRRVEFVILSK